MSAAEHLQEAIDVGCTRDDHDHIADHRAEVLAEGTALILAARDADEAHHPDDIAHINRRVGMREAAALLRREFEPAQPPSQRPQVRRAGGKDTGGAPAGESTQPAPDADDDRVMRTVRACLADFNFGMYGIDIDGPDPSWVGDLASAIAGALGGEAA